MQAAAVRAAAARLQGLNGEPEGPAQRCDRLLGRPNGAETERLSFAWTADAAGLLGPGLAPGLEADKAGHLHRSTAGPWRGALGTWGGSFPPQCLLLPLYLILPMRDPSRHHKDPLSTSNNDSKIFRE